ncbi:uncharacterized protein EAE97_000484 [Botrytis byssoidea]|uniref:Uncharacterized protein n=1 Tax=Botrytis byssoidea TaxID=139641 RepID=A0A9P5IXM6_9HELO|nr:uncharacterized protein EAE97_000484 [Botrytis byssoidea]KAF7955225.1 hypothetical protein EAE97_000484 [Botrytis byssoidea]
MAAVHARSKLMARDQSLNSRSSLTDTASSSSIERNEVEQPISSISLPVGAEIGIGLIIGIVTCTLVLTMLLLFSCIRRNRMLRRTAKDSPVPFVNEEDNPRARRISSTQDFEIHQKTPGEERSHAMSQHRWTSPDDVAPKYESRAQQERPSFAEVQLENREESVDSQNRQHTNSPSHIYSNAGEETPSYSSHHDSYGSWTNSPSSISQVPSYESSNSSQQQQHARLVHSSNSNPTLIQSHHPQQEVYMPRQESIKIQQPVPSYSPWRNHRLLNRTYSTESVILQQTPSRDKSRSQMETKQEVAHVANKKVKVKRGSAVDDQSANNSEPPKPRKHVKAALKRKTKDKSPRQNSPLTKTSNLQKPSVEHDSAVVAGTKFNQKARDQDQDRKRDQAPHPLRSHPYSSTENIESSKSHTKEKPLPSPPTEHPMIPELEGSEQKFL